MLLSLLAAVAFVTSSVGTCTASHTGNFPGACASPATSGSFSYTATGTGNAVLLSVGCGTGSAQTTVTLAATGWTLTQVGAITGASATGWLALFKAYAPNTSAATFTLTWSASCGGFMNDIIHEWSGADATNFVDNSSLSTNTTGGCSGGIAPVAANCGVSGFCNDSVTAVAAGTCTGSSWAAAGNDGSSDFGAQCLTVGGAGVTQTPSWTSTTGAWTRALVTIKPAAAAAGPAESGMRGFWGRAPPRRKRKPKRLPA